MTTTEKTLKTFAVIELILGVFYLLAIPAVPGSLGSYLVSGLVSILFGILLLAAPKSAACFKAAWLLAAANLLVTGIGFALNLKAGAKPASTVSIAVDLLYAVGVLIPLARAKKTE